MLPNEFERTLCVFFRSLNNGHSSLLSFSSAQHFSSLIGTNSLKTYKTLFRWFADNVAPLPLPMYLTSDVTPVMFSSLRGVVTPGIAFDVSP